MARPNGIEEAGLFNPFFLCQFLEPRRLDEFKLPWRLYLGGDPAELAREMLAQGLLQPDGERLTCSPLGREQALLHREHQARALAEAEQQVLSGFQQGDYESAARAYLAFESQQPFPNDRALNPTAASQQSLVEDLRALAAARPAQLPHPGPELVESVLLAWLWGHPLSAEGQILKAYLANLRDLQRFQAEGLTHVQVLLQGGCDRCLSVHEQVFAVAEAPALPLEQCRQTPPCTGVYLPDLG